MLSDRQIAAMSRVKSFLASADPADQAKVKAANEAMLRVKLLSPGQLHNDATLSNLSIQYKNDEYIGTKLMPVVTAAQISGKFPIYTKRDRLAVPDTAVGPRGTAAELNEHRTMDTYSCKPYALQNFVDELSLAAQDAPLNEMVDLLGAVNDVLDLDEELRLATILTTAANFSGNAATLSGTDMFDNGSSNPIKTIQDGIAATWNGFGSSRLVGYCSGDVMRVLSRHSVVRDLFKYTSDGLAMPKQLANYLGLDDILVSDARKDTANEGQTASYSRVWGKVFGIVRVANAPSPRTAAFGYTMRFGQKTTNQWFDPRVGSRGGWFGKVGMEEDHKICAADTGYLFSSVIA